MQLKLSIKQIKGLQEKHGIANLLQPSAEDATKVANAGFLVDFYFEGSRKLENAPSIEEIEDMDVAELIGAYQGYFKQAVGGNG
ncbi:hypothetical protein OJ996_24625 [Luteolibacter sp. GHJ8]|uniref:Phage protein n=1 Tax=Luteolibacter rhizosphaerae TaxID=2989719 RepID=A0ABT3GAC7_9BACT|nr:hypothetical protein [Luteolibacter rhizosphaerae]MCW1916796.1 hypothetical protein [Luteolibacter rhizosphaerae]